jgi:hypothetical protein
MSLYSLDLPNELLEEIQAIAQESQVSIEQWFLSAIAQRLEMEKTRTIFQKYAQKADLDRFDEILARVPGGDPVPGDELL